MRFQTKRCHIHHSEYENKLKCDKMYTEYNRQQQQQHVFEHLSSQLVHTLDASWSTSLESLTRHWSAIITSITSSMYSGSALLPASSDPLLLISVIFISRPYRAFMITRPLFASSSLRTRANVARISCTADSASLFFSTILLHENKNILSFKYKYIQYSYQEL